MLAWIIASKDIAYIIHGTIWSIGYFVSTVGITEEAIKIYPDAG